MSLFTSLVRALWITVIVYLALLFFAAFGFPIFSDFLFSSVGIVITYSVVLMEVVWLRFGMAGSL